MNRLKSFLNLQMIMGLGLLSLMAAGALAAPFWGLEMNMARAFEAPSWQHPFGLDENGVDVFKQALLGARISLIAAFSVVGINLGLGLAVGSFSAWRGGVVDQILMRVVDLVSAFPRFLLALAILAMLGAGLYHLIFAMCLSGWAGFARFIRGEIGYLKKEDYVLGALAYGAGGVRILIRHIWPNLWGAVLVQVMFSLAAVVIAEAGLSFLGLGLPAEVPSWGRLISSGRQELMTSPHLLLPGLFLFMLVFGFQLCAESLRKYFNPQSAGALA